MTDTAELIEPIPADLGVFEFGLEPEAEPMKPVDETPEDPTQLVERMRLEGEIRDMEEEIASSVNELYAKRLRAERAGFRDLELPHPSRQPHFVVAEVEQL